MVHVNKDWANDIENFISIGRINLAELSYMFHDTSFRGIIGPNWDTSRITSLSLDPITYLTDLLV